MSQDAPENYNTSCRHLPALDGHIFHPASFHRSEVPHSHTIAPSRWVEYMCRRVGAAPPRYLGFSGYENTRIPSETDAHTGIPRPGALTLFYKCTSVGILLCIQILEGEYRRCSSNHIYFQTSFLPPVDPCQILLLPDIAPARYCSRKYKEHQSCGRQAPELRIAPGCCAPVL